MNNTLAIEKIAHIGRTNWPGIITSIAILIISLASQLQAAPLRTESNFDDGWSFARFGKMPGGEVLAEPKGIEKNEFNTNDWRAVKIPHDWAIEGPFDAKLANETGKLPYSGIGWYKKDFTMPAEAKGQRHFIHFDGAMSHAQVYVNGSKVGEWVFGYNAFRFEMTDQLNYGGSNTIAVRLDNPDQSSRWYPGAGIYRHITLISTQPVHLTQWSTFIRNKEVNQNEATMQLSSQVANQSETSANTSLEYQVLFDGKVVQDGKLASQSIAAGKSASFETQIQLAKPQLWSPEKPSLYQLRVTVKSADVAVDQKDFTFGVRDAKFTVKDGFHLNGQRVQLNGVCMHHDLGPLGAATNRAAIARQIRLLKEMGSNAIRFSHNPPSKDYLELCDEMGMLAIDESFDCWRKGKKRNDYGKHFDEWHERDIRAWVRRDRNHPCIIAWSTGNEILEFKTGGEGIEISNRLTEIVRSEDDTRPVTNGVSRWQAVENGMGATLEVFGINYHHVKYDIGLKAFPDTPFYASETSSTFSSRGVYTFPPNVKNKKAGLTKDFHVSSYDYSAPHWGAPVDQVFLRLDKYPSFAGEFVWTGFDYIGEPTPFNKDPTNALNFDTEKEKDAYREFMKQSGGAPSRSSYFGIIDLCGFPKDRFYLYRSRWMPNEPTLHILPHWTWPDRVGKETPIHVYTNADEVELFVNGESKGRQKRQPSSYRLVWNDVAYQPGEVYAIAYKDGQEWQRCTVKTASDASKIELSSDRKSIAADGYDLAFITVSIKDKSGITVPRSMNEVNFSIEGDGEIVAVGNGDQTSHEPFQASKRKAFNGLCLAIVRINKGATKPITLKATSSGLQAAEITISPSK